MLVHADVACSVTDFVFLVHLCFAIRDEHSGSRLSVCLAAAAEAT